MLQYLQTLCKRTGLSNRSSQRLCPIVIGLSGEGLELRNLLSATKLAGGELLAVSARDPVSAEGPQHHRLDRNASQQFPDISGQWDFVTHDPAGDVHGILTLEQHGKKVTGTLVNDDQEAFPGPFKGKFVKSKAGEAEVDGKMKNFVLDSRWLKFFMQVSNDVMHGQYVKPEVDYDVTALSP